MIRIGIDLGGTKTEIIALDAVGRELLRHREATPRDDYRAVVRMIARLVSDAEKDLGERATVGIGAPGAVSQATGSVKNSNSVCLNGRPLRQDLEAILERPIAMANDANCFALSEAVDGAGAGAGVVFGVIVGTGVGAGVVVHGKVLTGANAIAGEWGHNPLPWPLDGERPGPPCYCGKRGCIETFLSGPGAARLHAEATGEALDARAIVERAEAGDPACEESMRRYEDRMARSLAHVVNILDPDVIVLGGGMSNIERLYRDVPALWGRYVFSDRVDTKLTPPRFGDSSGVRGAAWLPGM
ncbi:MAG: ROK family protein [Syntrophobacteraceae bacterium]